MDNGYFHVGFSGGFLESALHIFHMGVVLFQLLEQCFASVCIWIFQRFRVEKTEDLTAAGLNVQCSEEVCIAVGERRVHEDQIVMFVRVELQEVVADDTETGAL